MKVLLDAALDSAKKESLLEHTVNVRKYYKLAEEKLKLVESVELSLVIPAANQLRYAGCHLSRACVEENIDTVLRDLDKTQRHCKRAIYDSLEVGITNYLEELKLFQKDYRLVPITDVIKDYVDLSSRVQEISDYIVTPRDFQREEYWTKCTDYFEEIRNISHRLKYSRSELNKIRLRNIIGYGAAAAAIFGLFIGLTNFYFSHKSPREAAAITEVGENNRPVLTNEKSGITTPPK